MKLIRHPRVFLVCGPLKWCQQVDVVAPIQNSNAAPISRDSQLAGPVHKLKSAKTFSDQAYGCERDNSCVVGKAPPGKQLIPHPGMLWVTVRTGILVSANVDKCEPYAFAGVEGYVKASLLTEVPKWLLNSRTARSSPYSNFEVNEAVGVC